MSQHIEVYVIWYYNMNVMPSVIAVIRMVRVVHTFTVALIKVAFNTDLNTTWHKCRHWSDGHRINGVKILSKNVSAIKCVVGLFDLFVKRRLQMPTAFENRVSRVIVIVM